jgi:AcrR family transcriptional regulator
MTADTKGSNQDTRLRIITAARQLFARHGYEGTSIRAIAKNAEANIGAVNYHFRSKENLYWAVMTDIHTSAEAVIRSLAESSRSLQDFSVKVFDQFMGDPEFINNAMKMFLNEMPQSAETVQSMQYLEDFASPPGSAYFLRFLQDEVSYPLSLDAQQWFIKVIDHFITHAAMMHSSYFFRQQSTEGTTYAPEQLRRDLSWLLESIVHFLQQGEERFRNGGPDPLL